MRKVLVLDFEGGTFSLRNTHPNVDTIRITEWTQLQPIYQELERGGHGYETVVIDSASEAQKFSMLWIMKKVVENDSSRDIEVPSMREWGKNLEQMRRMVRGFRDLPMNCIFTAHATEEKDTKRGLILKSPSFSGKLKAEIAGFLDIVGFMYTKEVKGRDEPARLLLTGSTEDIVAKDRSGRLPLVLENPTMTQLYKTITDD